MLGNLPETIVLKGGGQYSFLARISRWLHPCSQGTLERALMDAEMRSGYTVEETRDGGG